MIKWAEHSWTEDHSSPEDGPSADAIGEYSGTAVEVIGNGARAVLVVGRSEIEVHGNGTISLEELRTAEQQLDAYGRLRQELDVLTPPQEPEEARGPSMEDLIEESLIREAAELRLDFAESTMPQVTTSEEFLALETRLDGRRCEACWDRETGQLLGVVFHKTAPHADHEDGNDGIHTRYGFLDLVSIAMDGDMEYWYDSAIEAARDLRDAWRGRGAAALSEAASRYFDRR